MPLPSGGSAFSGRLRAGWGLLGARERVHLCSRIQRGGEACSGSLRPVQGSRGPARALGGVLSGALARPFANRPGRSLLPPLLSETHADGGYRDVCSIARSLRGLLDACSILRQGKPGGRASVRRSRPTPCRQPERHSPKKLGASGRQLAIEGNWQVAARGRAASPTKAGAIL